MKKISIYILVLALVGCGDAFLDVENITGTTSDKYPMTPEQALTSLAGVYSSYADNMGIYGEDEWQMPFVLSEIMSDERLAGGSQADDQLHAAGCFKKSKVTDDYGSLWRKYWGGVFRANLLLEALDRIDWESEEQKNRIKGETLFLRAICYFTMCQFFGPVPLYTEAKADNKPRVTPEEMYAFIGADLREAISLLPNTKFQDIPRSEIGRASKWAAQALMARVFLFYTGYYRQEKMGDISKEDVIGWLDDCIENSGHDLIPDFRNLWPYSESRTYKYAKDNNLKWIGESGDNYETVFAILGSIYQGWRRVCAPLDFGLKLYNSPLGVSMPFGCGWGLGTVNPKIWEDWDDNDLRKRASIINFGDKSPENRAIEGDQPLDDYFWGGDTQWDETGYWQKKYMPITEFIEWDGYFGGRASIGYRLYGLKPTDWNNNNIQGYTVIRFADVLLMGAELGGPNAQSYLDRVRARVNLPSVPATLENIKKERRFELAFEGVRWFDLLRWHDAEQAFIDNMTNVKVLNNLREQEVTIRFRPETGGFLPIPETQIALSENVLVQNPGWGTDQMYDPGIYRDR